MDTNKNQTIGSWKVGTYEHKSYRGESDPRCHIPEFLRAPTCEERMAPIQAACTSLRIALKEMLGPDRAQALRMAWDALAEIEKAIKG